MDNLKIGSIIEGTQSRDAIHIAVAPVTASERLAPGQHVGFIGETVGAAKQMIGVVDPFLQGAVMKGERFWLFLYPNTVTSLHHHWTHPAFEDRAMAVSASEEALRRFADEAGITYLALMDGAKDYLENDNYLIEGGRWEGFGIHDDFWDHYEAVTGTKVPTTKRCSFFSCSC